MAYRVRRGSSGRQAFRDPRRLPLHLPQLEQRERRAERSGQPLPAEIQGLDVDCRRYLIFLTALPASMRVPASPGCCSVPQGGSVSIRIGPVMLVAALGLAAAPIPRIQFTDTKLANGLRLIVSEDHAAPMFSIVVDYNVGSRNERQGRTGFAHLFEHMMFKGSANVGPGEHPY